MNSPKNVVYRLLTVLTLLLSAQLAVVALGDDWKPADPAELASKTSVVEKDADAEALFWEVKIDDGDPGDVVFTNYVRVKVFTEKGKDSQSRIDLPYLGNTRLKDIAARTIKPDGTIVELKSEDIHERTIIKANGLKLKAKSFAMPGVEPGVVIEYRWREVHSNASANFVELKFQRDIPVREITYLVKPYEGPYGMRYQPFQMPPGVKFEKVKSGFYRVALTNVPAYHEEPRMPPEDAVRSWILLYYYLDNKSNKPDEFWLDFGKRYYDLVKDSMKVNDDVKLAASQIVAGAATPEEKLRRIYDYCQTKIKNISSDSSGLTALERKDLKPSKSPAETLKRGMGSGSNVDALFAALVNAAGMEAHLALSGNREDNFFDRSFTSPYFLLEKGSSFIAVRLGETWKFFSPAETYTPLGMLGWREEGMSTLVIDKEPLWVQTPISPQEKSLEKRTAKLKLLEDGTLEGDVRIEYTGQLAIDLKYANDGDSPTEREKTLTDAVKAKMSTAELSDIKVENVTDPVKPFVYSYHLRIPGYAQRTGKRIFLQPNLFTRGVHPVFTASARTNDIYFPYSWSEEDHITINPPAGFVLDNADVPAPILSSQTRGLTEDKVRMAIPNDQRTLIYDRTFFFGGNESTLFPKSSYLPLKQLFDMIYKNDTHTITLKQSSGS